MEIHEYQSKALLRRFNIKTLRGELASDVNTAIQGAKSLGGAFWVIKAQVHAGGRGLGGGIKKARSLEEVGNGARELIGKKLITPQTGESGKTIYQVLVEEGASIEKEFYLALLLDRSEEAVSLIVSPEGGIDIEEVAYKFPDKIFKFVLDPLVPLQPFQVRMVVHALGLPSSFFKKMKAFLSSLYRLMMEKEVTLLEINPLVLTAQGDILPLDAKISLDDNALFRQPEMSSLMDIRELPVAEQKAFHHQLSFVKLTGNIGCMVNGAGLAMATMDIVKLFGASPANFLDVGGGVDSEKIDAAFEILREDQDVEGILVNIFGGIVHCDLIAKGLIKSIKGSGLHIPIVVRLEGTHSDRASELLNQSGLKLTFAENLAEAAKHITRLTKTAK